MMQSLPRNLKLGRPILLACLVLCSSACEANDVPIESLPPTASELKALGREAIIEIAEKEIQEEVEDFSKENFDRIKVLVGEDTVYVTFGMSARYVPQNSVAYYGLLWPLVVPRHSSVGASFDRVANPQDAKDLGKPRFLQPDATSKEVIAFVLKVLEAEGDIPNAQDVMTIREKDTAYEVRIESEGAYSGYTISRETGEILNGWHGHNMPIPGGDEGGFKLEEL